MPSTSSAPYTAGPGSTASLFQPTPELIPTVRLTVMLGLEYDLDARR